MDDLNFHMVSDIIKNYIKKHNEQEDVQYVRSSCLLLNKNTADQIKVIQLQPNENITANNLSGTSVDDSMYKNRIDTFINYSIQQKADLILTPEYSIPYESINDLIQLKTDIKSGALFCLCAQGASKEEIEKYLENWSDNSKCYVYRESFDNSDIRDFWCILIYVFKVSFFYNDNDRDDVLFIIPQCKTTHMKDDIHYFETGHLSTGVDVYIFDLEHENFYDNIGTHCHNFFCSLLCSDVFEQEQYIEKFKQINQYNNNGFLIFHPQLNQKPYHGIFLEFRKKLFDTLKKDAIIITSTWGKDTKVNGNKFSQSNSALYVYDVNRKFIDDNYEQICKNHKMNVALGIQRGIKKWIFPSNDFVIEYQILKPNNSQRSELSLSVCNPFVTSVKFLDKNINDFYEPKDCLFKPIDILQKLCSSFTNIDYEFILKIICGECDKECKILDFIYFIGSFFGNFYYEELCINEYEASENLGLMHLDRYTTSKQKMFFLNDLWERISKNDFPDDLKDIFKDGTRFYVRRSKRIQEPYNLMCIDSGNKYRFVYGGAINAETAKNLLDDLCKDYEEEELRSTIIFYTDPNTMKKDYYYNFLPNIDGDKDITFRIDEGLL